MKPGWLFFLLCGGLTAVAAPEPELLRLEIASLPWVSQAASRLGDCIAPNLKDSAAAATVILTAGAVPFGMDLTKPLVIAFHRFGDRPSLRITAHAAAGVNVVREEARFLNLDFRVRLRNGRVEFFTGDPEMETLPPEDPGKNLRPDELLRATARPDGIRKHFSFQTLSGGDSTAGLMLRGLDELGSGLEKLELSFAAEPEFLHVVLRASAKPESAVARWLARPLPPPLPPVKFAGAGSLTLLRIPPTETLLQYGVQYLFRGKNRPPPGLAESLTGSAAMVCSCSDSAASVRLALGLRPTAVEPAASLLARQGYTPFPGLYQLNRNPPVFGSMMSGQLILYTADRLEKTNLEAMRKPEPLRLNVPDRPLVLYDLRDSAHPLAELIFSGRVMTLTFRAGDAWFASFRPLVKTPLHKLGIRGKRDAAPRRAVPRGESGFR